MFPFSYSLPGKKNISIIIFSIIFCLISIEYVGSAEKGEEIFQGNCAGCHTIGKGTLVGPDLSGVTLRREEKWLIRQIKDPDGLVAEKDPAALKLLKDFNMPMVALGLSDTEIAAIISYLKNIDKNTDQGKNSTTDLPSRYMPTVLISILILIALTLIALIAGRKKVK
ncbi:MAG: cytochrome c [Pelagibacteraceae bacterium]|jgi:cytochrome c553|nr:cytochrome c [Pelagibacteraceae bacterium]